MVSKAVSGVILLILCGVRGVKSTKKRKIDPTTAQSELRANEADVFTQGPQAREPARLVPRVLRQLPGGPGRRAAVARAVVSGLK